MIPGDGAGGWTLVACELPCGLTWDNDSDCECDCECECDRGGMKPPPPTLPRPNADVDVDTATGPDTATDADTPEPYPPSSTSGPPPPPPPPAAEADVTDAARGSNGMECRGLALLLRCRGGLWAPSAPGAPAAPPSGDGDGNGGEGAGPRGGVPPRLPSGEPRAQPARSFGRRLGCKWWPESIFANVGGEVRSA